MNLRTEARQAAALSARCARDCQALVSPRRGWRGLWTAIGNHFNGAELSNFGDYNGADNLEHAALALSILIAQATAVIAAQQTKDWEFDEARAALAFQALKERDSIFPLFSTGACFADQSFLRYVPPSSSNFYIAGMGWWALGERLSYAEEGLARVYAWERAISFLAQGAQSCVGEIIRAKSGK